MAVELTSWRKQPGDTSEQYQIEAFADSKADVTAGMVIKNLPSDWEIQPGSKIFTAAGEQANYKSDGTWEWQKTIADLGTVTTNGHTMFLS